MIVSVLLGWNNEMQIGAIHMVINHMSMLRTSQLRVVRWVRLPLFMSGLLEWVGGRHDLSLFSASSISWVLAVGVGELTPISWSRVSCVADGGVESFIPSIFFSSMVKSFEQFCLYLFSRKSFVIWEASWTLLGSMVHLLYKQVFVSLLSLAE